MVCNYHPKLLLILIALAAAADGDVRKLPGHQGSVMSVAYSPDGALLASSSRDATIKLWNARTGKLEHSLTEHADDVYCVTFSPKGDLLASGSGDKTIKL